MKEEVVSWRN